MHRQLSIFNYEIILIKKSYFCRQIFPVAFTSHEVRYDLHRTHSLYKYNYICDFCLSLCEINIQNPEVADICYINPRELIKLFRYVSLFLLTTSRLAISCYVTPGINVTTSCGIPSVIIYVVYSGGDLGNVSIYRPSFYVWEIRHESWNVLFS